MSVLSNKPTICLYPFQLPVVESRQVEKSKGNCPSHKIQEVWKILTTGEFGNRLMDFPYTSSPQ